MAVKIEHGIKGAGMSLGVAMLVFSFGGLGLVAGLPMRNSLLYTVFFGAGLTVVSLIVLAVFLVRQEGTIGSLVDDVSGRGDLLMEAAKKNAALSRQYFSRLKTQSESLRTASAHIDQLSAGVQETGHDMERSRQMAQSAGESARQISETCTDMHISAGQVSTAATRLYDAIKAIEDTSLLINGLVEQRNPAGIPHLQTAARLKYLCERMTALSGAAGVILKDNIEKTKTHCDISGQARQRLEKIAEDSRELVSAIDKATRDNQNQVRSVAAVMEGMGQMVHTVRQHVLEVKDGIRSADEVSGHAEILQADMDAVAVLTHKKRASGLRRPSQPVKHERRGRISPSGQAEKDQARLKSKRLTTAYFDAILVKERNKKEVSVNQDG